MNKMFRHKFAEKLIVVSLLLVAMAASSSYFYISSSSIRSKTEATAESNNSLGSIKPMGDDVRIRGERELNYDLVAKDADVFKNDRVYTGSKSSAIVGLKSKQQLTVQPNSLVVISDHEDRLNLDLKSGGFFGELKKGAKLFIKKGKKILEIKAANAGTTHFKIDTENESEMKFVVLKGEVDIKTEGETKDTPATKIVANSEATISEHADVPIEVKALSLHLKAPAPGVALWDKFDSVDFSWDVSDKNKSLTLDVSDDPLFEQNVKSLSGLSQTNAKMNLMPGRVYFWRVRSETDTRDKSPTSSFSYYSLSAPIIPAEISVESELNWKNETTENTKLSWIDSSLSESYEVQISKASDFSNILYTEKTEKPELQVTGLKLGEIFWRVLSKHSSREDLVSNTGKILIKSNQKPEPVIEPVLAKKIEEPEARVIASEENKVLENPQPLIAEPVVIPLAIVKKAEPEVAVIKNETPHDILVVPAALAKEPIKEAPVDFAQVGHFGISSGFEYARIDARDKKLNGVTSFITDLSPKVNISWQRAWTEDWSSFAGLGFLFEKITNDTATVPLTINESSGTRKSFELGVNRTWAENTQTGFIAGVKDTVFSHASSQSAITVDRISTGFLRIKHEQNLFRLNKSALFSGLSADYLFGARGPSQTTEPGYAAELTLGLRDEFKNFTVETRLNYGLSKQNSNLVETDEKHLGFSLGLSWRFDP